ncbi:hypothetical protein KAR91_13805 [Candidatus Pacearchaeota archaeon]|nr:hypothetical protein [Candidatus Pacearchaeota archaeon]
MKHAINELTDKQKRLTCLHCGKPLLDNPLVKDAYKVNSTTGWAKKQLQVLHDMANDREVFWITEKLQRIILNMETLK